MWPKCHQVPPPPFLHPSIQAIKLVPVGRVGTVEKQNLKSASQTNEQVSLMADWQFAVLPSSSLPLWVCVPSYMCVPFIFTLLSTHPKWNFKTWLQNIFVWKLIPYIDNGKSKIGIITSPGFTTLTCLSNIWNSSWLPALLPHWYKRVSLLILFCK